MRSEVALVSGLGVNSHRRDVSAPRAEENSRPLSLVPPPTTKLSHLLSFWVWSRATFPTSPAVERGSSGH